MRFKGSYHRGLYLQFSLTALPDVARYTKGFAGGQVMDLTLQGKMRFDTQLVTTPEEAIVLAEARYGVEAASEVLLDSVQGVSIDEEPTATAGSYLYDLRVPIPFKELVEGLTVLAPGVGYGCVGRELVAVEGGQYLSVMLRPEV